MSRETAATCTCAPCRARRARKRRTGRIETDEYGRRIRKLLAAYGRRVGEGDIEELAGLAGLADELEAIIADAVAELRTWDYSWADIGRVLGITRQAAQQRFGGKAEDKINSRSGGDGPEQDHRRSGVKVTLTVEDES